MKDNENENQTIGNTYTDEDLVPRTLRSDEEQKEGGYLEPLIWNDKQLVLYDGGNEESNSALNELSRFHFLLNALTVIIPVATYTFSMMQLNIKVMFRTGNIEDTFSVQDPAYINQTVTDGLVEKAYYVMGEDFAMFVILVMNYFANIIALIAIFIVSFILDFGKDSKTDRMSESKSLFQLVQLFLSSMWVNILICGYIA